MSKRKLYFENLDGLRFLCFLSVFFYHSFYTDFTHISSSYSYKFIKWGVFGNGNLGVNFFFVLSGFLITYLLIEEKLNNNTIAVTKFWMRRVLRIWPLFYFCVFFGFVIFPILKSVFGQEPDESATLVYYLTFLNNFDMIKNGLPDASILGVLWSVAIEEQFYFIWPLILSFVPVKKFWIPFVVVIIISLTFRAVNPSYNNDEFHTLSCIGDMAVGAFGAWFCFKNSFKVFIISMSKAGLILLYASFFLIFFFRSELFNHLFFLQVLERIIIAIFILFIILEQNYCKNSLFKMSRFTKISYLGRLTYGMYCLHFIGILIATNLTKMLQFNTHLWQVIFVDSSIALFITIIISLLSYRYFESFFLRLKNKFQV